MTRIEQIRQRQKVAGGFYDGDLDWLLKAWDTRDAAIRTLVEQLKKDGGASHQQALDVAASMPPLAAALIVESSTKRVIADALDAVLKEAT